MGSSEGLCPSDRGLGVSPNLKFLQEWGKQGVDEGFLNALKIRR
jgi:hypothetical protein